MSIPLSQEIRSCYRRWLVGVNEDLTQRLESLPTDAALAGQPAWRAQLGKRRRFR
jgi:hypothetical protein